MQFLGDIGKVGVKFIRNFGRVSNEFPVNKERLRVTLTLLVDVDNGFNTSPCFPKVVGMGREEVLEMILFTLSNCRDYFIPNYFVPNVDSLFEIIIISCFNIKRM